MPRAFYSPITTVTSSVQSAHSLSIPKCGACKLCDRCNSPKMPMDGNGKKRVMIVGEAPGKEEDEQGRPFVGAAGRYLLNALDGTGIDFREDCWITNALICRPPNNTIDDPRKIDYCRPNIVKRIKESKPEVVILLGLQAVRSVLGWLWKDDVGTMARWAGWQIPSQQINAWVCPTFHPSHVMREEGETRDRVLPRLFTTHLHQALDLKGRPWAATPPDYTKKLELLTSPSKAIERITAIAKHSDTISFDYETTTLKPDSSSARIVCCAVSNGRETISYPWTKETAVATQQLLRSSTPKIGYNVKFEERWTIKEFGHGVKNWVWDGMLAAHVLDNRSHITGLKFQAFVRFGIGAYDANVAPYLKSAGSNTLNRINDVPMAKLLEYCAMDALLEHKVCKLQMEEMSNG